MESRTTLPASTSLGSPESQEYHHLFQELRLDDSCQWYFLVHPGPNLRTCCPALEDESASGTPTTGIVSSLQNTCPFVFEQIQNPDPEAHHPPSRGPTQPGGPGPGKHPLGLSRHTPKHPALDTEDHQ
ncbi:hypothetical protein AMECASPLE_022767 [Ameca splendens]|uniref:Uncharacterized protein n=1 Tax=Ameca splendens TaxID=208324 RepID=A0ABV0XGX4_9TELE